ncbi:MAG: hypothetical protein ACKE8G_07090 [Methylophagaceae bacterium]
MTKLHEHERFIFTIDLAKEGILMLAEGILLRGLTEGGSTGLTLDKLELAYK